MKPWPSLGSQIPFLSTLWLRHWEQVITILTTLKTSAGRSTPPTPLNRNSVIRKGINNRRIFPSDRSAFKIIYLAIEQAAKKWTMPIKDWKQASIVSPSSSRVACHLTQTAFTQKIDRPGTNKPPAGFLPHGRYLMARHLPAGPARVSPYRAPLRTSMPHRSSVVSVLAGLLLFLLMGSAAGAATLTVNTLDDNDIGDNKCSLREAITAANNNRDYQGCTGTNYGDDTIRFDVSGIIALASSLPILCLRYSPSTARGRRSPLVVATALIP